VRALLLLVLAGCVPDLVASKKTLRAAVDDTQEDLDACYAKSLERDADGKGEMALTLHVLATGRVESAKVTSTEVADPKLDKCITGVLTEVRVKPAPPADFDIDYTVQLGGAEKSDDNEKPKKKKPASDDE
jgi:hypothetical protein